MLFAEPMRSGPGILRLLAPPTRVGEDGREGCRDGAAERDGEPGIDISGRKVEIRQARREKGEKRRTTPTSSSSESSKTACPLGGEFPSPSSEAAASFEFILSMPKACGRRTSWSKDVDVDMACLRGLPTPKMNVGMDG